MRALIATVRPAFMLVLLLTLLLGAGYPLLITGAAQLAFSKRADGSLVEVGGQVVGSKLIGQQFSMPHYFWGRPSATTPPYNPAASGGSNLGMSNPLLGEQMAARIALLKQHHPADSQQRVPIDLITASASGLDPHISLDAALFQLPRVAKARGMSHQELTALIRLHERRGFATLFAAPYVHVLELNRELDAIKPMQPDIAEKKKQVKSGR